MASPAAWEILSQSQYADCRIFKVLERRLRHPHDKREGDFFVIECPDWVLALPVTREGRLVLVRQYRVGSQSLSWEPPGGVLDHGENPLDAGIRETREETGHTGARARIIGSLSPNPAILANVTHLALIEDCEPTHAKNLDPNEEIESTTVSGPEAVRMVMDGRIHHALAVAALFKLREIRPDLF